MDNQATTEKIFTTRSVEETKQLASCLAQYVKPGDVILLKGDLGAGKTQFSQGLAEGLGIMDAVISPTFNILLEYHTGRVPLYHFDLYRLNDEEELEDIAFYETLESGGVSVIEWWDKFPDCMPEEYLSVEISVPVPAYALGGRTIVTNAHTSAPDDRTVETDALDELAIAANAPTNAPDERAIATDAPACADAPDERTIKSIAVGARYSQIIDLWCSVV